MGKFQRDKGLRIERKLVHLHHEAGLPCERVPLSGSAGGSFKGDLIIGDLRAEVKGRATGAGFKTIVDWKEDNDLLFLVMDRREPLVVMDFSLYEKMLAVFDGEGNMIY